MVSLVGPMAVGVAPASALWFEPFSAFLILIGSLAVSAAAVFAAGLLAHRSARPLVTPPPRSRRGTPFGPAGIATPRPVGLAG